MARGVNKVLLLGNVGQAPDVVALQNSGTLRATFSLATNAREKVGGEWKDVATWHYVVAWARLAEVVQQYVRKGSRLYVEGRLRKWKTNEGQWMTEVVAEQVLLLDGGSGGEEEQRQPAAPQVPDPDDDLPF